MKSPWFVVTACVLVLGTLVVGVDRGWSGSGLVELTKADPSCPDGTTKLYVDCGNGTVTDNRTGLVWLKNANCHGQLLWSEAMLTTQGLSSGHCCLTDGSSPGDWRLPSKEEWEAMISDFNAVGCSPYLTNDAGTACWGFGTSSFTDVQVGFYLSATTAEGNPTFVWFVNLSNGFVDDGETKASANYFWPVRNGQ